MYLLRMNEALEGDYPAVAHFLGDRRVRRPRRATTSQVHPSRSYTFNRLGERFPSSSATRAAAPPRRSPRTSRASSSRSPRSSTRRESPAWPAEAIERMPQDAWPAAVLEPDRGLPPPLVRVSGQRVPAVGQGRRPRPPGAPAAAPRSSPSTARTTRSGGSTSASPRTSSCAPSRRAVRSARPSRRRPEDSRATPASRSSAGCATGSPRACSSRSADPPRNLLSAPGIQAEP